MGGKGLSTGMSGWESGTQLGRGRTSMAGSARCEEIEGLAESTDESLLTSPRRRKRPHLSKHSLGKGTYKPLKISRISRSLHQASSLVLKPPIPACRSRLVLATRGFHLHIVTKPPTSMSMKK